MTVLPLPLRLRHAGIVYPNWTRQAAKLSGCPLGMLCAVLMLETSGGRNVYGHDPTIFIGAGEVTEANYRAYKAVREQTGECQGVGPAQLTSASLQDEADQVGGCWQPEHNIAVAAHYLKQLLTLHADSVQAACAAYNGTGPAAELYGQRAVALVAHFRSLGIT